MIKKILLILIIFSQLSLTYAEPLTSTNNFPFLLEESDIPIDNGGGGKGNGGGLDGGAVTAITLGSIGVGALGLIALFLYKKYSKEGLVLHKIIGCDNPILSICMDKCSCLKFVEKHKDCPLLIKALKEQDIKPCPNSRYILIPDTELPNKSYDNYIFEIPENLNNIKITQAIENKNDKLKFNLYYDKTEENEVKLNTIKNTDNIHIESGKILNSKYGMLTVLRNNLKENQEEQKYAIVIELSR